MLVRQRYNDRHPLSSWALARLLPRALPKITEYLAHALYEENTPEPDWDEVEWRIARAVAAIHGISSLLSKKLMWPRPSEWQDFLESQRAHTASRYLRMAELLTLIEELSASHGIAFVPLKGVALHAIGLYVPGDRPMADIDLLVKPAQLEPMSLALSRLGYRPVSSTWDERILVPKDCPVPGHLGERADHGITIELHARIDRRMPVRKADITEYLWTAAPRPGRNEYPSLGALMAHLLMHAAVNMQLRILRMLQLHDIALLASRLSASDWNTALSSGDNGGLSWWAMPPLQLARHYYPGAIPAAAIDTAGTGCSPLLRLLARGMRISEVSASNPRRSYFPALSWSGSLAEAARCVGFRLNRGMQALRGSAPIPAATELQPWITPSHRRRLVEVLLGRSRPETLLVVRAALERTGTSAEDQAQPKAA